MRGALLGLAVGDALGQPAQFLTPSEIRRRLGARGITDFVGSDYHPAGSVSDETHTAIATSLALVEAGQLGVDAVGLATAAKLVQWSREADMDRGPDATVMRGIHRLAEGIPWRGSGDPGSRSAGALIRSVPVGLAFAGGGELLAEMAQAVCFPTHAHPVAVASSVAGALLVALALEQRPTRSWLPALEKALTGLAPEVMGRLETAIRDCRHKPALVLAALGEGWSADEVLARSLYATRHHPEDFEPAVLLAANASGDTAATAAMTGALMGAWLGPNAIPKRWRERVERASALRDLAGPIARMAAASLDGTAS